MKKIDIVIIDKIVQTYSQNMASWLNTIRSKLE